MTKKVLFLLLTAILILPSCNKEEKIIESTLTNGLWEVDCIDLGEEGGITTISGSLDYGTFNFYTDGTYARSMDSLKLSICNPTDPSWPYIIWPNGMGTPFGDINGKPTNPTWKLKKNKLSISSYGEWEIIEHDISSITFKSNRSDYKYHYRLKRK